MHILQAGDSQIFDQYLHVEDVKHHLDIVTKTLNNTKGTDSSITLDQLALYIPSSSIII